MSAVLKAFAIHSGMAAGILMVVATRAEARRLEVLCLDTLLGAGVRLAVSGVGPAAAALATQRALLAGPLPALVVSAGIGGAYPGSGLRLETAALASELVYGDLGAWDGGAWDGGAWAGSEFLPLEKLGLSALPDELGTPAQRAGRFAAWDGVQALAAQLGLPCGPFVTLSAASGSAAQAAALVARFPGALMEGMEGAGVAQAAALHGVPCTELRGVSNFAGPRDRAAWRIGGALDAMTEALAALVRELG